MQKMLAVVVRRVRGGVNFRVLTEKQTIPGGYKFFGYIKGEGKEEAGDFLSANLEERARELTP